MDNVNCFGYETSLTQCRQIDWGLTNCDPFHGEDAGVVCDNTTVEEVSNNYCRRVNDGLCSDLKVQSNFFFLYFHTSSICRAWPSLGSFAIVVNFARFLFPGVRFGELCHVRGS